MRIGMGALGTYQGPAPVTLIDGTVIQDPNTQSPTAAQCVPYQCGADPDNQGARLWCAYWGRGGALDPCAANECGSYGASLCARSVVQPVQPSATVSNARVTQAVTAAAPTSISARLTPQNIVSPMPDITQALAPVPVATCSDWQLLNGWIQDNSLLAAAILAGAFMLAYRGRNGRR
jgi:hypothetical protein